MNARATTVAEVRLWGRTIGAVALAANERVATFEYAEPFLASGIQVAPIGMPLKPGVFRFPALSRDTFHGLPGLLADSLPDRFGNALIDAWLAADGRDAASFNPVERLCYTGMRGIGALEFAPALRGGAGEAQPVAIDRLVALASTVLGERRELRTSFAPADTDALRDILRVGTSAGGARAKAVIAWNRATNEVRSGQAEAPPGFRHWLLKFDGVSANADKELDQPQGFGAIEYAYSLMARDAGVEMMPCHLYEEGGRRHFMTARFDRLANGDKVHMQSLCGLAHYDFNLAGGYSYEQALRIIRQLGLPMDALEQQFRRMVFNVVARNQDDHVKNIAFLMDRAGRWQLSPAFDVTYSFNPAGAWTSAHQMTLNGKRDDFTRDDLRACARTAAMARNVATSTLDEVTAVVADWPRYAAQAGVSAHWQREIGRHHRLRIS